MEIKLKRAYDAAEPSDGYRVFVDRLWPRGLSHATFHYDLWEKQLAPTDELRHFLHADPEANWPEFRRRYAAQLKASPEFAPFRSEIESHPTVTLLYASHDVERNNAVVLRDVLTS